MKNSLNCRETVQFVRIISTFTVLVSFVAVICKFYTRAFCSNTQIRKEENGINGTSQGCWQPANYMYGKAYHKTMPWILRELERQNTGAAEYTSIVGVLIWHCCVNRAIKTHRPTTQSWRLTAVPGGWWSLFLPVIWQKYFHWALSSMLLFSSLPHQIP